MLFDPRHFEDVFFLFSQKSQWIASWRYDLYFSSFYFWFLFSQKSQWIALWRYDLYFSSFYFWFFLFKGFWALFLKVESYEKRASLDFRKFNA